LVAMAPSRLAALAVLLVAVAVSAAWAAAEKE
jgi:hypothetical protein